MPLAERKEATEFSFTIAATERKWLLTPDSEGCAWRRRGGRRRGRRGGRGGRRGRGWGAVAFLQQVGAGEVDGRGHGICRSSAHATRVAASAPLAALTPARTTTTTAITTIDDPCSQEVQGVESPHPLGHLCPPHKGVPQARVRVSVVPCGPLSTPHSPPALEMTAAARGLCGTLLHRHPCGISCVGPP